MITSERIFVVVGAVLCVFLQLLVAPYIAVLSTPPNFIVAFALVVAVVRPSSYSCVLPFLLGLAFDFIGGGPIGAMAFSLTAFSVLAARLFKRVDNDSLFMAFSIMALGILLVELSYGALLLFFGYSASVLEALVFRTAPLFLYDCVIALVMYPPAARFAKPSGVVRTELTQLR